MMTELQAPVIKPTLERYCICSTVCNASPWYMYVLYSNLRDCRRSIINPDNEIFLA